MNQATASAPSNALKPELMRLTNVSKTYPTAAGRLKVLHNLSINLYEGETLGIVGESGSGKSTLAKTLLGLVSHDDDGEIFLDGAKLPPDLAKRSDAQVKAVQIVFQNPESALNRVRSVGRIIGRALYKLAHLRAAARDRRLHELMAAVRLADRYVDALPRQLSGGLKQRVAIARAFAGAPRIVVCDEPTSALDVSVQASILNLLNDLQAQNQVTYVFISHDLGVVRYISDRIIVLYLGRILEIGTAEQVFSEPHHPYTEALLSAVPNIDGTPGKRIDLADNAPSAIDALPGCVFQSRCHRKIGVICEETEPVLAVVEGGHSARCHLVTPPG
jgi:peptide/nickel transport system ATP-binding protein